ncbi:MAG: hypothetical protein ABSH22_03590 [Tepidisphaeraceae bacterium]|jgi:hypothetical protein
MVASIRRVRQIQWTVCATLAAAMFAAAFAQTPATQPATQADDPTVQWLLSQAPLATAPSADLSAIPATAPAALVSGQHHRDESRLGEITLSNGQTLKGRLSTTLGQPLRVWEEEKKQYEDIPFSLIDSMRAVVVWERMEQEWKFKESGSDVKEYSGRGYPTRFTNYQMTLTDGTTVSGSIADPIYLETPDGEKTFILHKTDTGQPGQTMTDLVYVQAVRFTDQK